MNYTEHKFLADFQPLEGKGVLGVFLNPIANFAALFGVAYVIGYGLRLGLGL